METKTDTFLDLKDQLDRYVLFKKVFGYFNKINFKELI